LLVLLPLESSLFYVFQLTTISLFLAFLDETFFRVRKKDKKEEQLGLAFTRVSTIVTAKKDVGATDVHAAAAQPVPVPVPARDTSAAASRDPTPGRMSRGSMVDSNMYLIL
jgi:hypothetical protein